MWHKELTLAIVENDTQKILHLLENLPSLENSQEIESAQTLLNEAKELIKELQIKTQSSMTQMQNNIKFLKATQTTQDSKFNILS